MTEADKIQDWIDARQRVLSKMLMNAGRCNSRLTYRHRKNGQRLAIQLSDARKMLVTAINLLQSKTVKGKVRPQLKPKLL